MEDPIGLVMDSSSTHYAAGRSVLETRRNRKRHTTYFDFSDTSGHDGYLLGCETEDEVEDLLAKSVGVGVPMVVAAAAGRLGDEADEPAGSHGKKG